VAKDELRILMDVAEEGRAALPSTVSALAEWETALSGLRVACGVAEPHFPPLGARFTALERAGRAVCALLETRSREHEGQFRVLTWIRQTCDAVAGVRRERENKRAAGARGAVTVLVARYRAREAEIAELRSQLDAARDAHTRLREQLDAARDELLAPRRDVPSGYAR